MSARRWWLVDESGARRRIEPAGVLIGRSPACDVVASDATVSRSQALVHLDRDGPRLVVLGRADTRINGEPVTRERALAAGDAVELPGLRLQVTAQPGDDGRRPGVGWVLQVTDDQLYGVTRSPLALGGGDDDDLRISAWPPGAALVHVTGDSLSVECVTAVELGGQPLAPGDVEALYLGAVLSCGGSGVRVAGTGDMASATTLPGGALSPPTAVRLEFLPRGGRLHVTLGDGDVSLYLSDRRCDLVASLLKPTAPLAPGDLVPDAQVIDRVWPDRSMSRTDLNVLVHRTRKELMRAGLPGAELIERARGGGATRFLLAAGARVVLD